MIALGCVLLGLTQLIPALWIVVAPHSFFEHVGPFGVYNAHYLGDAAAFQAGIGLVLLVAAARPSLRPGAIAVGAATVGIHAINHWLDVSDANGSSNADVMDAISLPLLFAVAALLLRQSLKEPLA